MMMMIKLFLDHSNKKTQIINNLIIQQGFSTGGSNNENHILKLKIIQNHLVKFMMKQFLKYEVKTTSQSNDQNGDEDGDVVMSLDMTVTKRFNW